VATHQDQQIAQPVAFRETADCLTSAYGTKWNGNASADNGSLFAAQPVAFAQNVRDEVRLQNGDGQIVGALSAESGMHQTSYIAQPLPFDTTQLTCPSNYSSPKPGDPCHPLAAGAHIPAVAFDAYNFAANEEVCASISTDVHHNRNMAQIAMQVRRLTPVECERLQGFPDNHTNIPWRKKAEAPDGPRYKALGNSMAVPVMRWIGERINA
jgi:site-specific DNA-cytosine methylase